MQFNIQSLGSACQLIQLNPVRINEVAKSLGIVPVGYINGVPHFDVSDVERIAAYVRACESPTVNVLKPSY